MLGITSTDYDEILLALINQDIQFILDFTHREAMNSALEKILVRMVIEDFHRINMEGISNTNLNGIVETPREDYSTSIYKALRHNRKLRIY